MAQQLLQESMAVATKTQSRTYENLSFRANVIAYLKAMVLYVAHGGWDESFTEFIRWSKEYDLYCKMAFFGDLIEQAEKSTQKTNRRGPANLLSNLPDEFTAEELSSVLKMNGRMTDPLKLIHVWKNRGYIEYMEKRRFRKVNTL